ncbi:uncharacterized protein Pyn_20074 [Prunus yedoensis var. nudiflora]|uniref:Translation initiation factor 3 N-terminal domain-containing protein n=1 Tax=Prunus yedoensis var. nudiflora TaxID=2094558 RepID=A0A314Z2F0_PRUYE|nr:uncharacterized protein Pyn_20074 [Prunus yedoensis var. nudiflora]
MAFWGRISQSKLRQLSHHSKTIPYAALLNPTVSHSKACVSENPYLISHCGPTDFGSKVRFFAVPSKASRKKIEKAASGPRLNEKIEAQFVRLVMDEGHCIVSRSEALERARKLELDLVEVQGTDNPPVVKIMDFHKEKYKRVIREKERIKIRSDKTLRSESKEVKFSPKTEAKDLRMKADMVKRFMEKGYRVKCTATDAEDKNLEALFAPLTVLMEDVALVEWEPTRGKGKEAYIIVRHRKFGPSKGAGKKTKTEEETTTDVQMKGSDDANATTSQRDIRINTVPQKASSQSDISDSGLLQATPTRAHTVPLPPRESSDGTKNRYRNDPRNPFPPRGMDNRGPGMREPRQAQTNAPVFRNSTPPPNDIPKQEPSSPSAPRTTGPGYGIFSNQNGNAPPRHRVTDRVPANSNSPSSRPDSSQRPGAGIDKVGGFGIFSRESSGESPNRTFKPN